MIHKMGVREFAKDFNKLQEFDIIEIIDKKTNTLKGIFLSKKEALKYKEFLEKEKKKKKEEKLAKIMQYAGTMEIEERLEKLSKQEWKKEIAKMRAHIENE